MEDEKDEEQNKVPKWDTACSMNTPPPGAHVNRAQGEQGRSAILADLWKLDLPGQSVREHREKLYWMEKRLEKGFHLELLGLVGFLLTGNREEYTGMEVN